MENLEPRLQRSRRNFMKMGTILASSAVARAHAANLSVVCHTPAAHNFACNCFLKGTRIRTSEGERKIEDLGIGDLLPTVFGGLRPIQWVGRYPIKRSDPSKHWVKDVLPIRISRSALAQDVPHADLYVTEGHSLLIDGLLVPVGNLINGTSIFRDERDWDELEFFHIKLQSHNVIYAEGAPADTLLNVDECAINFADYFRRFGTPEKQESPCAPRATYGGGRGEFKSRIRSAVSPWVDHRQPLDVIRDRLEERGIELARREFAG
jgi:hypothetical protein